jgi:hypothetical protein
MRGVIRQLLRLLQTITPTELPHIGDDFQGVPSVLITRLDHRSTSPFSILRRATGANRNEGFGWRILDGTSRILDGIELVIPTYREDE